MMSTNVQPRPLTNNDSLATTIATYSSHTAAQEAIYLLEREGYPLSMLSIIARDFETAEQPIGKVTSGMMAGHGAAFGGVAGGLLGILFGASFLILPGIGPVLVAGPFLATLVGGVEGAFAGAAVGGLSGALLGYGVSGSHVLRYESEVRAGKFLVMIRATHAVAERARALLSTRSADSAEVFHGDSNSNNNNPDDDIVTMSPSQP